jgi:N-acetylglucosaminyldiphosphoundecaprenol N-acetyl-beta-D-mannosaminyltransferase
MDEKEAQNQGTPPTASVTATAQAAQRPFPRRYVLGAPVDLAAPEAIVAFLTDAAQRRQGCSVVGISAPYVEAMRAEPSMRDAFETADILIPDGRGFVWGARMLDVPVGERIAMPDLCELLLAEGNAKGWNVFLYGGTEEVNQAALANIRGRFPALALVEGRHGWGQSAADEDAVIARVGSGGFHLLLVARPSPDKELFLARARGAGAVGLAVGGYADILAGKAQRAPRWVQAAGCEWLWRTIQEPRRMWRRIFLRNLFFALHVVFGALRRPADKPWWTQRTVHLSALCLAVTAAYLFPTGNPKAPTSLNVPWHFDDTDYIRNNPALRSWSSLSEITVLRHRYAWWASNRLCRQIGEWLDGYDPETQKTPYTPNLMVFHAWNVLCHLLAVFALYALLRRGLRFLQTMKSASPRGPPATLTADVVPFLAASLFAVHPLCTEAVTYVCGRDNSQGGMFYLWGLYFAALTFERLTTRVPQNDDAEPRSPAWIRSAVAALLCGAAAVLTKEVYVTFPLAIGLLWFAFYRSAKPVRATADSHFNDGPFISMGMLWGALAGLLLLAVGLWFRREGGLGPALIGALLSVLSLSLLGGAGDSQSFMRSHRVPFFRRAVGLGPLFFVVVLGAGLCVVATFPYVHQRFLGALGGQEGSNAVRSLFCQAYAVPKMLGLALWPFRSPFWELRSKMNIDHDFPTLTDPTDPRVWGGGAVLAMLVLLALVGLWRKGPARVAGFAVLAALLSLAPSNSVVERGDIVSERNFYLATAFAAAAAAWALMALATAAARLTRLPPANAAGWALLAGAAFLPLFWATTVRRNQEWSDSYLLWDAARRDSPQRLRAQYNFGVSAMRRKEWDEAQSAFEAVIAEGERKTEDKELRADEVVQLKTFQLAYAKLAELMIERWRLKPDREREVIAEIDRLFQRGLERTVYEPDLVGIYAQFLFMTQRRSETVRVLETSVHLHPWAEQLYQPLGLAYMEAGHPHLAQQYLSKALNVRQRHVLGMTYDYPQDIVGQTHGLLGLAEAQLGNRLAARNHFRKAAETHPPALLLLLAYSTQITDLTLSLPAQGPDFDRRLAIVRQDVLELVRDALKENPPDPLSEAIRKTVEHELTRRKTAPVKKEDKAEPKVAKPASDGPQSARESHEESLRILRERVRRMQEKAGEKKP